MEDADIGLFGQLVEVTYTAADAVFGVVWQLATVLNTPFGRAFGAMTMLGAVWRWRKSIARGLRQGWEYRVRLPASSNVTVRLVPEVNRNEWDLETIERGQVMRIHGRVHASNVTDEPVRLVQAHIRSPHTEGEVLVEGPPQGVVGQQTRIGGTLGSHAIPPHQIKRIEFSLFLTPPVRKEGVDFETTVFLTDHLGNEHAMKHMVFKNKMKK